jgi:predicted aldo/keto reductase-like oxidoreductase
MCVARHRRNVAKELEGVILSIPLRKVGKNRRPNLSTRSRWSPSRWRKSREVIEIVRQALDDGITFYDNAWEYYHGKTESWLAWASKAGVTKPLS